MKLKTVVVNRKTWLRGEGGNDSRLLRESDRKMCCIGFVCVACGIPKKTILELDTVQAVHDFTAGNQRALNLLPRLMWNADTGLECPTMQRLYSTNDIMSITDEKREEKLITLGAEAGIKFVFKG